MHVSAFTPRQCSCVTHLGMCRIRIYPHASVHTRRMWDNTGTSTYPDMRRGSWDQSVQTTTREMSFAYIYIQDV